MGGVRQVGGLRSRSKKKELTPSKSNEWLSYSEEGDIGQAPLSSTDLAAANPIDYSQIKDWDIAVRYHTFKNTLQDTRLRDHLRGRAVSEIIRQAAQVIGSVVRPKKKYTEPLSASNASLAEGIDIDQSLESQVLVIEASEAKKRPVIVCIDTSLSMTGEKLALTAVAVAVVALQFKDDPVAIIAFESTAQTLKRIDEKTGVEDLLERFMDVPAQGYTHLEDGLRAAIEEQSLAMQGGGPGLRVQPATVLVSDGKYTAGRDPAFLGDEFYQLEVIKMGEDKSSLRLCSELARRGNGRLRQVRELQELPEVMYGIVKDLLRGRASG